MRPLPRLRAVLFDAHGTLLLPREPVGETYARFAREQGVDLPAWRIDDAFRRILAGMPPRSFPELPLSEVPAAERAWWRQVLRGTFLATDQTIRFPDLDAFFEAVYAHYAGAAAWAPCEGAVESLEALRRAGLRLGIASNFDERLPKLLEALDMDTFFGFVAIPSTVGASKPDPALYAAALAGLGVPASEAAYVGDDAPDDLDSARRAGLLALPAGTAEERARLRERLEAVATLPAPAPAS